MQWQGRAINSLNDLELVQAYNTCLEQEARRTEAANHSKFTQGFEHAITKRKVPAMNFPPPNPYFIQVKEALKIEIDKRGI